MSVRLLCRSALRRSAVPLGLGLSTGVVMASRQRPFRFDARPPAQALSTKPRNSLDPETIKQLSKGSVTGFVLGLVISIFSRTLVQLAGLGIIAIQVASRYGIDFVDHLKLTKRAKSSRFLTYLVRNPVFGFSFGLTFILSAFASF
ncbi:hypothetical protein VTK73DRAFT_674 [Phialemonium thermophilum]|uniref:Uncharacterized protein n=1 Tax=Phialemonium thermophilum TaxID=223376 RepID=A0ABR3XEB8_9PEZI